MTILQASLFLYQIGFFVAYFIASIHSYKRFRRTVAPNYTVIGCYCLLVGLAWPLLFPLILLKIFLTAVAYNVGKLTYSTVSFFYRKH